MRAHWAAVLVTLAAIVLAVAVRVRLAGVPLERDEGEYAYAGHLILQGIPPYSLAYNMKFPGIYYSYALIMALFGQSPRGIHLGLALVNAATAWLLFVIARRLLGRFPAAVAAVSFVLLSLDRWIMGVFAHATHFVLLPVLAAFLVLLRSLDDDTRAEPSPRRPLSHDAGGVVRALLPYLGSGVLLGVAVLMKQHAVFFLPLGVGLLVWSAWRAWCGDPLHRPAPAPSAEQAQRAGELSATGPGTAGEPYGEAGRRSVLRHAFLRAIALGAGAALPLAVVCVVFLAQGVLGKFWFWTFQYAREYVSEVPLSRALQQLSTGLGEVTRANLLLWLLGGAGVPALWLGAWSRRAKVFLSGLLVVSCLSVCPGFYFREHYFILLLPALALFIGVFFASVGQILERAVSRFKGTVRIPRRTPAASREHPGTGPIPAVLAAVLFAAVAGTLVLAQWNYLVSMSPRLLSRTRYGSNPFIESVEIARYIRERTDVNDRIAVLGSEPQIYFYADRKSATGYIYVYALMEPQRYASRMQDEMIGEIESAHPSYLVFVPLGSSWLARPGSEMKIMQWASRYTERCYDLVGIADIVARDETRYLWDEEVKAYRPATKNVVYTFHRKSDAPCVVQVQASH